MHVCACMSPTGFVCMPPSPTPPAVLEGGTPLVYVNVCAPLQES